MVDMKLPDGVNGSCDARFAEVPKLIAKQLAEGEHHGVAFAAFLHGEPVIDVWGGSRFTSNGEEAPWERDTMTLCWSTTKGVTATALHMAMERAGVDPDANVASVWPEFGRNGKDQIKIRQLLSHEAGVPQIRDQVSAAVECSDWEHMVEVMENLTPLWDPGTANGYHAINYGWLAGEALRRIDGRDVPTFLAEELAGPMTLDGLFIKTPESELERIAPLIQPDMPDGMSADDIYDLLIPKDGVLWKAFGPRGDFMSFLNSPAGYTSCIPSVSGVFTARSLAKMYAIWANDGVVDGERYLEPSSITRATTVQNERPDLVMTLAPRWRMGFLSAKSIPCLGPNPSGFGHVGLGGTYAAADPLTGLSFALVYDKFGETEFLGGPRGVVLADAAVAAAA